jgi:hypothetical protein
MKRAFIGGLALAMFVSSALADTKPTTPTPVVAPAQPAPPPPPPCTMQTVPDNLTASIDKNAVMEIQALLGDVPMTQEQRSIFKNDVLLKVTAAFNAWCAKQKK